MPKLVIGKKEIDCKLVVFDKDGTLLDQLPSFLTRARARREAIRQYSNEKAAVLWEKIAGVDLKLGLVDQEGPIAVLPLKEEILVGAVCFYLTGYSWEEARRLVELAYETAEKSLVPPFGLAVFPGVRRKLDELKNHGFRLAVASTDTHKRIEDALNVLGIGSFFDTIIGVDDVVAGKPSPDMLDEIMKQTKLEREEIVIVGDSVYDMEMGRNAKLKACIAVLTGSCRREKLEPLSDAVINSVSELRVC
jgi:phosphoglycolate phosphatase